MKKFKFKLEAALSERKRVENFKLKEWGLAQRILQGMKNDLTALENRLGTAIKECSEAPLDLGWVAVNEQFISGTKIRISWKQQEIARGQKLTDKKHTEYVGARQKREALEKVKEKKHDEHRILVRKEEFKTLDDIYIMNGAVKRREADE